MCEFCGYCKILGLHYIIQKKKGKNLNEGVGAHSPHYKKNGVEIVWDAGIYLLNWLLGGGGGGGKCVPFIKIKMHQFPSE